MPVDDRTRLNLHRKLDAVLGPEEADTLMAHLPPVTWNEVATKDDLRTVETVLRSEMHAGFAELRGEMHAGFAELRGEMHAGFADLRTEIATAVTNQTKWLMTGMVAWSAVLLTAVRCCPEPPHRDSTRQLDRHRDADRIAILDGSTIEH